MTDVTHIGITAFNIAIAVAFIIVVICTRHHRITQAKRLKEIKEIKPNHFVLVWHDGSIDYYDTEALKKFQIGETYIVEETKIVFYNPLKKG